LNIKQEVRHSVTLPEATQVAYLIYLISFLEAEI